MGMLGETMVLRDRYIPTSRWRDAGDEESLQDEAFDEACDDDDDDDNDDHDDDDNDDDDDDDDDNDDDNDDDDDGGGGVAGEKKWRETFEELMDLGSIIILLKKMLK